MAVGGFFEFAKRAFFSGGSSQKSDAAPKRATSKLSSGDRQLLKLVKKSQTARLVEVGISSLERTQHLITQAVQTAPEGSVHYTGFDWFEERESGSEPLALIKTHRELVGLGGRVKLTPGNPAEGVPAQANTLPDTDMILLSAQLTDAQLEPIWFYLPRMCHPGTQVLREQLDVETGQVEWKSISMTGVNQKATASVRRIAA